MAFAICGGWMLGSPSGLPAASASSELETHVFDPVLSLRGACATSSLDPVPDPGCPYPPPPGGPQPFSEPRGVAVDDNGYVYVANLGEPRDGDGNPTNGSRGRIDIFDPAGEFVTEISAASLLTQLGGSFEEGFTAFQQPAVDSAGNLLFRVVRNNGVHIDDIVAFAPSAYPPTSATTYVLADSLGVRATSFGIDPANDHVYVRHATTVSEYDSVANGAGLLRSAIASVPANSQGQLAIGPGGDIFVAGLKPGASPIPTSGEPHVSQVYVFDRDDGQLKTTIDGSDTVAGGFNAAFAQLGLAVDAISGNVYVYDSKGSGTKGIVYEFQPVSGGTSYQHISTIERSFQDVEESIAKDDSPLSPNQGHLFVTSHPSGIGALFAFKPKPEIGPPVVSDQSFTGVTTTEAVLRGKVNPKGETTRYAFQYVDEATYLSDIATLGAGHGFDHASEAPLPPGTLPPGSDPVSVSAALSGLSPGTTYRFRLVAENCVVTEPGRPCMTRGEGVPGGTGADTRFATYPAPPPLAPCANEILRAGLAARLPDCRAYELVTSDTNGRVPTARIVGAEEGFDSELVSPDGDGLFFGVLGGSLPGKEGTGGFNGDAYEARRSATGWTIASAGPSGAQAESPMLGGVTGDRYSLWNTAGSRGGSLVIGGAPTHYVRSPDGSFSLVGKGSRGEDPQARGRLISPDAGHVIFTSEVRLEDNAPPSGTEAIYDRTSDGITHVVSLLPGNVTPGTDATFLGASSDGSSVAFRIGSDLYLREDNEETVPVAGGNPTYTGIAFDGERIFYLQGGDVFAFDVDQQQATPIGSGGESIVVNISADGSRVYFISPAQLDGAEGQVGEDNLYVWDGASVRFIGIVDPLDVTGVPGPVGGNNIYGLGLWTQYIDNKTLGAGPANDASRTTPDGRFLVFESRASLSGTETGGHSQVYRYDATAAELICLSCNPTLAPAQSSARLQTLDGPIASAIAPTANVVDDGQRVFFESDEALVPGDVDGVRDVYQWSARGHGGCDREEGCLHLLSGGHSDTSTFLYAVGADGRDVFFHTADFLLGADLDGSPSIYDAREGGGFAEPKSSSCLGDGCKPAVSGPPLLPPPASSALQTPSAQGPRRRCPKGKRKVRRGGKVRCVKLASRRDGRKNRGSSRRASR